ncbi:MAG: hypothetical protein JSV02_09790 [Dehalococcoidia bacterium]|nr:MAG: hypothetical protein JSV02_09790 [Dehalococcoidia bacterium]
MNRVHRIFGRVCENCALCNRARENPDGMLYKIWSSPFHGSWCPSWQGYKKLEEEGLLKKQQAGQG